MNNPNSPDKLNNASDVIAVLNDAVRANPIAASLIGLGAVWLFAGGSRLAAVGGAVATGSAGAAVGSGISTASRAVGGGIASASQAVGGAMRDMSGTVIDRVQSAASAVRQTANSGYDAMAEGGSAAADVAQSEAAGISRMASRGRQAFTSAQKNLTQTLERQPLVLGGIGLAIGAAIASGFALTRTESDLIGDTATKLRGRAEDFASDAADKVRQVGADVLATVKDEAQKQGLSTANLKDSLADVGGKLKTAASQARDSAQQKF
jgi:hypothetical protein